MCLLWLLFCWNMKYFTSYNFNKRFVHGDNIGLAQSDEDWIYEQNEAKRENKDIVLQYITGMGDIGKVIRTLKHIQYQLAFLEHFVLETSVLILTLLYLALNITKTFQSRFFYTTMPCFKKCFKKLASRHIESSQLIWSVNQLTGFYITVLKAS